MSIVAEQAPADDLIRDERSANRFSGLIIAVSASLLLWSGIGLGIWGLVTLAG